MSPDGRRANPQPTRAGGGAGADTGGCPANGGCRAPGSVGGDDAGAAPDAASAAGGVGQGLAIPGYVISKRLYTLLLPRGTVPYHAAPAPPKSFGMMLASSESVSASRSLWASTLSRSPTTFITSSVFGLKTPLSTCRSSSGVPTPSTMR